MFQHRQPPFLCVSSVAFAGSLLMVPKTAGFTTIIIIIIIIIIMEFIVHYYMWTGAS